MDAIDRKLLVEAEKGLLLTPQPFHAIAVQVGITPQEVIARLQRLQENGVIRRFGLSLKPNDVGYNANALVAWKVPQSRIQEIGEYFSGYNDISHCYERGTVAGKWEYNVYTVIHAHERQTIEQLVKLLSDIIGLSDYLILYSTRNLKTKPAQETGKC
jgi:DNA-binding Lrp family transcriptional regulator